MLALSLVIDVCGKSTPPEKNKYGKTSFKSTKSGAGEQFPPPDCKAKARARVLLSQTPTSSMLRPISVLRFWISEGLAQDES